MVAKCKAMNLENLSESSYTRGAFVNKRNSCIHGNVHKLHENQNDWLLYDSLQLMCVCLMLVYQRLIFSAK